MAITQEKRIKEVQKVETINQQTNHDNYVIVITEEEDDE
jgi:hypothetical protein